MVDREELFELEETFRQLFRRIKLRWNRFEEQGVSASQAMILEKLNCDGPLKVSQIAEALWITAGAVTSLSDKLISGGFAKRSRSEEDRRVVYLEITDQGEQVLQALRKHRSSVVEEYFGSIPGEDAKELHRIFKRILSELPDE